MAYEDDYIMRQIHGVGELVMRLIGKEYMDEELRDIFTTDGRLRNSGEYIESLIGQEEFQEVNRIIDDLKFKLNLHSHTALVDKYTETLAELPLEVKKRNGLTEEYITELNHRLKDML